MNILLQDVLTTPTNSILDAGELKGSIHDHSITSTTIASNNKTEIIKLKENVELLARMQCFLYALLTYSSNEKSTESLQYYSESNTSYFFSLYYFTESEIEYLLNFPTPSGYPLKTVFDYLIESKLKDSNGEICTSHVISPIIYKTFNIRKGFYKEKQFLQFLKKFKGLV